MVAVDDLYRIEITDIGRGQCIPPVIGKPQFVMPFDIRHGTERRTLFHDDGGARQGLAVAVGHDTEDSVLRQNIGRSEQSEQQKNNGSFHHGCTGYR